MVLGRNVAEELAAEQERAPIDRAAAGPEGGDVSSGGGMARLILRTFVENRLAVVGVAVLVLMVLFCFVGPFFYHTNQTSTAQALATGLQNGVPTSVDPLGNDASGFDILGRLMYGGQISLTVGFAAAGIATLVGVLYGAIAGFLGGWFDAVMMRIVDILLSVPILFLLITLTVMFSASLWLIIIVIGGLAWLVPARLVRGETLSLRIREYVQAVRVMGGSGRRIVLRHIIPNSVGTIVVNATFQVADAILYLAALGFLGLGVPLPETDWGSMLNQGVDALYSGYWWQIYPAAGCIVLVVVALNFIGDALRDALEVRLQRR